MGAFAWLDPASRQGPILLTQVSSLIGTTLSYHEHVVIPHDYGSYSPGVSVESRISGIMGSAEFYSDA